MDDVTVERVLRTVECIPAGHVAAYGEIGSILGVGPRLVGRIMSTWGSNVPWWRVTNASGDLPAPLRREAFTRWEQEGIAVKPNGRGCRIREHGTDLEQLARDAERACADLGAPPMSEDPRAAPHHRLRENPSRRVEG